VSGLPAVPVPWRRALGLVAGLAVVLGGAGDSVGPIDTARAPTVAVALADAPHAAPATTIGGPAPVAPPDAATAVPAAPAGLPTIGYGPAPAGFPADPQPASTVPLTTGAHPTRPVAAYDAPGGRALAYLAPSISGVPLTVPVVMRRQDWTAVLLPSANRRLAWLPPGGWASVSLPDQIVVDRGTNLVTWYHGGTVAGRWTAALGSVRTPTPLGRSFVLGRTPPSGRVYAGVDVLVLGSIPDDPSAVPTGLRGAHIGIHAWYDPSVFGRDVSNGCIRMPRAAQQVLVGHVVAGTEVVVLD
jgi:hypothetical protein